MEYCKVMGGCISSLRSRSNNLEPDIYKTVLQVVWLWRLRKYVCRVWRDAVIGGRWNVVVVIVPSSPPHPKKNIENLTTERHPPAPHHCYPVAAEFSPFPSQRTDVEVDDPS